MLNDVELDLVDSVSEAERMLRWLGERHENDAVGIDIETGEKPGDPTKYALSPWHGNIRLAQIGDTHQGWAIPWDEWAGVFYEAVNRYEGKFIIHNVGFEGRWFGVKSRWDMPWHRVDDTMLAAQVIDPTQSAALKTLTTKYVDPRAATMQGLLDQKKSEGGWTWGTVPIKLREYWAYGALDTVISCHLWDLQRKMVGPGAPFALPYELEMATRRVCTQMELAGARIDIDYCRRKYEELRNYADSLKAWGKDTYGASLTSGAQLIRVFEDRLGAEITELTERGNKRVDKDQLKKFVIDGSPEVQNLAQTVLNLRKAEKLAETYLSNALEDQIDGLLHANIRTMGARTGRMSITSPGPALQTLPKKDTTIRTAFIPRDPENEVLLSSDLDQVEFRMTASLSQDPGLIQLFLRCDAEGGDSFTEIMREIYADPSLQKSDPRRGLVKNCVPLTSEILTKRGWLKHDEVKIGDETIGYDFETGASRWTKVTGIYRNTDAEIYRLYNGHRSFLCTKDHRWVADGGRAGSRKGFIHAYEHPNTEKRIILAAPAEDGPSDITPDEARILGWVLGDGSIRRREFVGAPSQGTTGARTGCQMMICQTKPTEVAAIDQLLVGSPHTRRIVAKTGQVWWTFKTDWARAILNRAGIQDKHHFDPWTLALSLSGEARQAMIDALDAADGKNKKDKYVAIVQAANSPVAELCVALGYLTGRFSKSTTYIDDGSAWQRNPVKVVWHQNARMTGQRSKLEYVEKGDVWCVTTELGSWTMRQPENGHIPTITGNTVYGKLYGAGIPKMALSAGVPEAQMRSVVEAFDSQYPGVKQFSRSIENEGMRHKRAEGIAYITTGTGRRLPANDGHEYALTNYRIQGGAAEVFKTNLLKCDAAGLTPFFVVPVHDEIVLSAPKEHATEIGKVLKDCMTTTEGWAVPLTSGLSKPLSNWGENAD